MTEKEPPSGHGAAGRAVILTALLSPPFSTLSYLPPCGFSHEFLRPGLRLAVPLGRSLRCAVLLELRREDADAGYTLKEAAWPLENSPLLSREYLDFASQFALRQSEPVGRILSNMLPAGLQQSDLRLRFFMRNEKLDYSLKQMPSLDPETRIRLAGLWKQGYGRVLRPRQSAETELCSLAVAPPWPVRPSATRHIQILDWLARHGEATRKRLNTAMGTECSQTLKALLKRGLINIRADEPQNDCLDGSADESAHRREHGPGAGALPEAYRAVLSSPPPFRLNQDQLNALSDLNAALEDDARQQPRLLYGVTGSGKTAVYLEFAAKVLLKGKKVLLLAPEVALAIKLRHNAEERFPGLPVTLFHGYQPPGAREKAFRELAANGGPALVVGTRSALFLQMKNLGAIILDEEHDSSFKQDDRLRYQSKDLAWYLSRKHKIPLVLGSATPDIKTFYAAESGNMRMHRLPARAHGGDLPAIRLSVMQRGISHDAALTQESAKALSDCVSNGNQAVILLNRRGYAPFMLCTSCGKVAKCPNCEVSLSYHKKRERLICHYCGFSLPYPSPCQECKGTQFVPLGDGTEKLEERLPSLLPLGARVLRLDRDSAVRPGSVDDILQSFAKGDAEVLVGTQMLSKGLHFPRVTLAIVVDGDLGLSLPEYNAPERTFQLLLQTAGRAGRGEKPGEVIIQTRDPGHYCWDYVMRNDYDGFYRQELERRRLRQYPPFVLLALTRITMPLGWAPGPGCLNRLGVEMHKAGEKLKVKVLGPAAAPFPMRDRRMRFQCLLKGEDWQSIRGVFQQAQRLISKGSPVHMSLDLDPASMM